MRRWMLFRVRLTLLLLLCLASFTAAQSYLGDYVAGDTIYFKFTTVNSTGLPTAIAGTAPGISIYKNDLTTECTTGVTFTSPFDSRTGMHHVTITTASDATCFSNGSDFQAVITGTSPTVDGVSVLGYVVAHFSLGKRANELVDMAAGTVVNNSLWAKLHSKSATAVYSDYNNTTDSLQALIDGSAVLLSGTLQASTTTTAVFPAAWNIGDEAIKDALIWLTSGTGAPAFRYCTKYTNATDTCTISPPWAVAPNATTTFTVWPVASTGISLNCRIADSTSAAGEFDAASDCTPAMSASNDAYNNMYLVPQSGTFAGVPRCVSDYVGATRTFFFTGATNAPDEPFPSAPANGTPFKLIGRCQR